MRPTLTAVFLVKKVIHTIPLIGWEMSARMHITSQRLMPDLLVLIPALRSSEDTFVGILMVRGLMVHQTVRGTFSGILALLHQVV